MNWTLDPKTLQLANAAGQTSFTAREFSTQKWPPCPVCATPIVVDSLHTPDLRTKDAYILGRWRCRNGCNPRTGERG